MGGDISNVEGDFGLVGSWVAILGHNRASNHPKPVRILDRNHA